jgi:hypothetical protein
MNTYYTVRTSHPSRLFSFALLDGLPHTSIRLICEQPPAGFGLEHLATVFMNNPGLSSPLAFKPTN